MWRKFHVPEAQYRLSETSAGPTNRASESVSVEWKDHSQSDDVCVECVPVASSAAVSFCSRGAWPSDTTSLPLSSHLSVYLSAPRPSSVRQGHVHLLLVVVVAVHRHRVITWHGNGHGHGTGARHGNTHRHMLDHRHRHRHVLDYVAVDVALHGDVLDDRNRHWMSHRVRLLVHERIDRPANHASR